MAYNNDRSGGFKRGGRDNDRSGGFAKKSFGGDRNDRGPRDMFKVTCSDCGRPCEVPFRPTGEKPVYCNDCFSSKRDSGFERAPRREFNDREPRPSFDGARGGDDGLKKQIENLGFKIDKLAKAIEAMSQSKPAAAAVAKEVVKVKEEIAVSVPKAKKEVKKAKKETVAKPAAKKVAKKGKK